MPTLQIVEFTRQIFSHPFIPVEIIIAKILIYDNEVTWLLLIITLTKNSAGIIIAFFKLYVTTTNKRRI